LKCFFISDGSLNPGNSTKVWETIGALEDLVGVGGFEAFAAMLAADLG